MRLPVKKRLFSMLRKKTIKNYVYQLIETECKNARSSGERLIAKLAVIDKYLDEFKYCDNIYNWVRKQRDEAIGCFILQDAHAMQHDAYSIVTWDGIRYVIHADLRIQVALGRLESVIELCSYLSNNEFSITKKGK